MAYRSKKPADRKIYFKATSSIYHGTFNQWEGPTHYIHEITSPARSFRDHYCPYLIPSTFSLFFCK